jgi:hypothetical protein
VGDLAFYGPFSSTCGSCSYDGFMSYHDLVEGLNPRVPNVLVIFSILNHVHYLPMIECYCLLSLCTFPGNPNFDTSELRFKE